MPLISTLMMQIEAAGTLSMEFQLWEKCPWPEGPLGANPRPFD